jgi:hypothetical protein
MFLSDMTQLPENISWFPCSMSLTVLLEGIHTFHINIHSAVLVSSTLKMEVAGFISKFRIYFSTTMNEELKTNMETQLL